MSLSILYSANQRRLPRNLQVFDVGYWNILQQMDISQLFQTEKSQCNSVFCIAMRIVNTIESGKGFVL